MIGGAGRYRHEPIRYRSVGDNEMLVLRHGHLVKAIASRTARSAAGKVDVDDLIQAGMVGLLECARRYRPGGVCFEIYAMHRIRGAILDSMRRADWCPRSVRRRVRAIEREKLRLEHTNGGPAQALEIAAAVGITLHDYHCAMRDFSVSIQPSLSDPAFSETRQASREDLDRNADPVAEAEHQRIAQSLRSAIAALPECDRVVFALYYDEHYRMREIGRMLNVSESRISKIHRRMIGRLRAAIQRPQLGR